MVKQWGTGGEQGDARSEIQRGLTSYTSLLGYSFKSLSLSYQLCQTVIH